ncbi:MAG: AMP-binding protein [Muribaculaceae bacterium]|nr:AMP-binding protein [Muribaculaceae bacterium]
MEYTDFLKEWYSDTDFVVVHTSGSTGKPKEIRLPKVDMLRSARATVEYFELTSRSSVASLLPMSSIATRMAVVRSIVAGCRYIEMPVANDFIVYEHIDLLSVGPSQTDCLIQHPEFTKRIGAVMVGGAPLGATRREGLIKAGYRVWESYGMTETCSNVALRKIEDDMFHANEGISFSIDGRGCLFIHAPDIVLTDCRPTMLLICFLQHRFAGSDVPTTPSIAEG